VTASRGPPAAVARRACRAPSGRVSGASLHADTSPSVSRPPRHLPADAGPRNDPTVNPRSDFSAAGGTHDDWDTYDRGMRDERRTAVLVMPPVVTGTWRDQGAVRDAWAGQSRRETRAVDRPFRSGIVGYRHDYELGAMTVHGRLVCAQASRLGRVLPRGTRKTTGRAIVSCCSNLYVRARTFHGSARWRHIWLSKGTDQKSPRLGSAGHRRAMGASYGITA
jgi:hypothetical protein